MPRPVTRRFPERQLQAWRVLEAINQHLLASDDEPVSEEELANAYAAVGTRPRRATKEEDAVG